MITFCVSFIVLFSLLSFLLTLLLFVFFFCFVLSSFRSSTLLLFFIISFFLLFWLSFSSCHLPIPFQAFLSSSSSVSVPFFRSYSCFSSFFSYLLLVFGLLSFALFFPFSILLAIPVGDAIWFCPHSFFFFFFFRHDFVRTTSLEP